MAINKGKLAVKKKTTANSASRASNSNSNLKFRNKVNYNQRILAALYTLCRRKHKFLVGITGSTLNSYLKKFTNKRLDTHTKISDPAMKRAKRELEEHGLIEIKNGHYKLAESARENIIKNRQERNDSDDDEQATVTWFKSTFPHSLSPRSKTPVQNPIPKTATTTTRRKSLPKKRLASKSLSSEESSADERVVLDKSKDKKVVRKGKKVKKLAGKGKRNESESDLTELESSNDEEEEMGAKKSIVKRRVLPAQSSNKLSHAALGRLTKADLIKKLEEATSTLNRDEKAEEVDEDNEDQLKLKVLAQGFQKLQEITQVYKSRLEKYEEVIEDEDGNPLSPIVRVEDEDRGGMDDMFFDENEDSGFFQLDDAASNAGTEVSKSGETNNFLDPSLLEKQHETRNEITGFDAEFPELSIDGEHRSVSPGLSRAQLQLHNKELLPTRSFTSNHIPSPASSFVGASRSNDDHFTDDEDKALYGTDDMLDRGQKDTNFLQTPAVSSSPSKESGRNTESTQYITTSEQPRSSSIDKISYGTNQKLETEIEIMKDSLKLAEVERDQEREKFVEMKSGFESELQVVSKQYQDYVETNQNKIQSLEAIIVDFEATLKQAETTLEMSQEENEQLKIRLQDCEIDLKDSRDEIETLSAELKEARSQVAILEGQLNEQIDSSREALSISEAHIVDLQKSCAELTSRQVELESDLVQAVTSMSVKPSVDVSVYTGEDPAFETLRTELTLERDLAVDKVVKELNLANESFASLQIKYSAAEKEFKEVIAQEKEKVVHAEDQIQILNERLEDARISRVADSNERETLLSQVQSIEIEKMEVSALLMNARAELNDISIQSIELAAQNTSTMESLQREQKSTSQTLSTLAQNLATLSSRYNIIFSTDDPQSSLFNLVTKLEKTDATLKSLSTAIMSTLSARHDSNVNDQTISEPGDSDLIIDLRTINSRLSTYLEEVTKSEESLEEVKAQLDSRNLFIRQIISKTGELEQLCDSSRTEILDENEIFEGIEVVKDKISKLEEKLVKSSKTLEILEEEKKIASLEFSRKINRLTEVEKEYVTYRRESFEAYRSQGEKMGWSSELKQVDVEVEEVQGEEVVMVMNLS